MEGSCQWREAEVPHHDATEPNAVAAEIHDRMPVIVESADFDSWPNEGGTAPVRPGLVQADTAKCATKYPYPHYFDIGVWPTT